MFFPGDLPFGSILGANRAITPLALNVQVVAPAVLHAAPDPVWLTLMSGSGRSSPGCYILLPGVGGLQVVLP